VESPRILDDFRTEALVEVLVKHNGTNITHHVISYTREARICTGIGTLDITLEGTYSATISPWHTIDIHENGSFQVRYYVSDVTHSVPGGTITLQCQDISKRLVDYFIPDSYSIDYPSYTRYWIEKFLDEAGISYQFENEFQGNLLSNYTQLGLTPAYDQIMLLLQLSGWYMYFDGNGVAVIGSLNIDLAETHTSLGKTDIINIVKKSNDNMLRNRALVWGSFNPLGQSYAFADITVKTPWNYDSRDVRTMVVSNQNISDSGSAYNIANILIKEFARITVEKHITAWGARNFNLGASVRVDSHVWKGKGLVTTFGVSMDRNGLVTNIILDERCPRLFGFFNFGDWVYVGTFGDGVWRKHIRYDHTFHNFSTGLTNLAVTDLHINNGMFGAVTSSGEMFYAKDEAGPWYPVDTITGLVSSLDDVVASGVPYVETTFSGLMGRATIIDRTTNSIKFGIDTYSGDNTGDYFMSFSGLISDSFVVMSGNRGWIVECDPSTGEPMVDTYSGVYPISYSGNYNMFVLDLENDGKNDYVSVATVGSGGIPSNISGYNWGRHQTDLLPYRGEDTSSYNSFPPLSTFEVDDEFLYSAGQLYAGSAGCLAVFNNEMSSEKEIVWVSGGALRRVSIAKEWDEINLVWELNPTTTVSPALPTPSTVRVCISKLSADLYRLYKIYDASVLSSGRVVTLTRTVAYIEWNANSNTLGSWTNLSSIVVNRDPYHTTAGTQSILVFTKQIDGVIYAGISQWCETTVPTAGDPNKAEKGRNYIKMYMLSVDSNTNSELVNGLVYYKEFNTDLGGLATTDRWRIGVPDSIANFYLVQNGGTFAFHKVIHETTYNGTYGKNCWLIYSRGGYNFDAVMYDTTTSATDPDVMYNMSVSQSAQLTGERYYLYAFDTGNGNGILYNGDTIALLSGQVSTPWYLVPTNIYLVAGTNDDYYIAKNGTDWYFCNAASLAPSILFTPPTNYTISKPYSTKSSVGPYYYWQARDADNASILMATTTSTMSSEVHLTYTPGSTGTGFICGNFLISEETGATKYLYIDNNKNVPNLGGWSFMVLQRDVLDFGLIRADSKPIRIDISNNSPVLTALDIENSFQSAYIFEEEVTVITPISGLDAFRQVRDYRYTQLETTTSGTITGSGAPIQSQILYVTESGVYHSDSATYSGGFTILDVIPSGMAERIETTNYTYPGQYIFVTTSGEDPAFYQRDNDGVVFTYYSGLPPSRATIVRIDDRN